VTVTDRAGNVASKTFTLYVNDMTPPVPAFPLPTTWPEDVGLALDATNTTDNDAYWFGGSTGNFTWTITGARGNWTVYNQTASFAFDEPGTYTVELLVLDGSMNSANLTKSIRINDTRAPTINVAGTGTIINEGSSIFYNASLTRDNDPCRQLPLLGVHLQRGAAGLHGRDARLPVRHPCDLHDYPDGAGRLEQRRDAQHHPARQRHPRSRQFARRPCRGGPPLRVDGRVRDNDTADAKLFTLVEFPSGMSFSGATLTWTRALTPTGPTTSSSACPTGSRRSTSRSC